MNEKNGKPKIDNLLQGIDNIVDLFKDLKDRVVNVEQIIDGKYSDGKHSLFKQVQDLIIKTEQIEKEIQKKITLIEGIETRVDELETLRNKGDGIKGFIAYIIPILSLLISVISVIIIIIINLPKH